MSHQLLDETSARAFRAAKFRYVFILVAIAVFILICIGIFIFQNNQKTKLNKLATEYAQIESVYYKENQSVRNAPTKLEQELKTNEHAKSTELFSQFALTHPKESYGWQAAIRASEYDINNGNIQAAKELFEAIMPYISKAPLVDLKVRLALAGIYTQQKDIEKSLQQFDYIDKIQHNPIKDQTQLLHAQALYVFGKVDDARQILSKLETEQAKIWLNFIET